MPEENVDLKARMAALRDGKDAAAQATPEVSKVSEVKAAPAGVFDPKPVDPDLSLATPEVLAEMEHKMKTDPVQAGNTNQAVNPSRKYHVFYSTIRSCRTVTESGRVISFVNYKFITDVPEDIQYLQSEIAQRNPYYYTKPEDEIVEASDLDPMAKLRKQFFEEFKAEQAALAEKVRKGELTSESEKQGLTPTSSKDVQDLAAGSDSAA